jgi:hypothetical protein
MGQLNGASVLKTGRKRKAGCWRPPQPATCHAPQTRSTIRSGLEAGIRQPRHFEDTGGVAQGTEDCRRRGIEGRFGRQVDARAGETDHSSGSVARAAPEPELGGVQ